MSLYILWTFIRCPLADVVMGNSCSVALNAPSAPPFNKLTICAESGNAPFRDTAPSESELII